MNNQEIKTKIDACLLNFYQSEDSFLNEGIRYSIQAGGKRFRPILLVKLLEGFNFPLSEDIIKVGAALEMIHTSSLIHDDLPAMDDDDYRRGKLTNHQVFGEANAILAGDALLLDPFYLLCQTQFEPLIIVQLVQALAEASGATGMVLGQSIDINSENKPISAELLKRLHAKKTGAMIRFPFIAAGIIANLSQTNRQLLAEIGDKIGLAFQIRDDIIDVTESFETLGKTPMKDAKENKATYVTIFGLNEAQSLLINEIEQIEVLLHELTGFNASPLQAVINQLKLED